MKKQLFLLCALSVFWTTATAQSPAAGGAPLTLDDCMAYAVEHSHDVAQQDLANANYRQDYIESVASLVPSLGGSAGASTSFGRAADPETNTYERMNWPADRPLQIDTRIRIDDPAVMDPYADVLAYALDHHPKAEVAAYEERQSRLRLAATRGRQYPSLSVGGGFSTNFFKNIEDWSLYASYADQLRDNRSHYFSAQLSVPIFGGLARRTAVNRARNNYRMAQQRRQQTLRQIESEVAQAYQQMQGTGKELVQATRKSSAAELAYRAAEAKYDRGMISTFDLQTASNNLLQARSERLRARLQYIVKTRLVEYYNGRPLIRQQ